MKPAHQVDGGVEVRARCVQSIAVVIVHPGQVAGMGAIDQLLDLQCVLLRNVLLLRAEGGTRCRGRCLRAGRSVGGLPARRSARRQRHQKRRREKP